MREWNADSYHQVSTPQFGWGVRVLDRLPLTGHERVLDVVCGSGRLTEKLAERLPDGYVIAVDVSANMLARAREHLMPHYAERVSLVLADAAALPVEGWADAVFSTATLHWVPDHPRLFRSIYRALAPGGRLVAQCGGGPNIARLHGRADALMHEPLFAPFFEDWREPWEFSDTDTTTARLAAAGFVDVETSLEAAPASMPDAEAYTAFITTVICRPYLACLQDESLRGAFLARLTEQAAKDDPPFELDYWRLNMSARRP
jgi:trans-aconitate methyltransferase